jgi:hypothetical protein
MGVVTRHRYGLTIVLTSLFALFWVGQTWFGWVEYKSEQTDHGEAAELSGYYDVWARTTLENWQSEMLQLASFVVLSAVLVHVGSPQSKDGDERLERKVDVLLRYHGLDTVIDQDAYIHQGAPLDDELIRKFAEWEA